MQTNEWITLSSFRPTGWPYIHVDFFVQLKRWIKNKGDWGRSPLFVHTASVVLRPGLTVFMVDILPQNSTLTATYGPSCVSTRFDCIHGWHSTTQFNTHCNIRPQLCFDQVWLYSWLTFYHTIQHSLQHTMLKLLYREWKYNYVSSAQPLAPVRPFFFMITTVPTKPRSLWPSLRTKIAKFWLLPPAVPTWQCDFGLFPLVKENWLDGKHIR